MAEQTPLGGLAQAAPQQAASAEVAPDSGIDQYLSDMRQQQLSSQKALDARRESLLQSISSRKKPMFDPRMLAVASGMLRPTKTGGFGESLGYAAENLTAAQEKQALQEQADEKMQYEIEQMAQEQKRKMLSQGMISNLLGQQSSGAPMPAGNIEGSASAPAMRSSVASHTTSPVASPSKNVLENLSDQQLFSISAADPDTGKLIQGILENRRKGQESEYKRREVESKEASVKRYLPGVGAVEMPISFWTQLESAPDFDAVSKLYKKYNLPLNIVDSTEGSKRFMSEGEISNKNKGTETTTTERAKSSEKGRDLMLERGDQAPNLINTADSIYALASDPTTSGAFGILAKPGVKAAIGAAIAEGIKVGNYSVGFPAIEDVIRKIGGTQKEIDAALMAARYSADLELGFRKTFLAGQGSVSNMEAEVTRKLGGGISDSPKVAMAKSEVIKARALFDQKASELLQDWEDKNPDKNSYTFKRSPEYKTLVENYSGHLKDLMGKYFQNSGSSPTPAKLAPRSNGSLLDQIRGQ